MKIQNQQGFSLSTAIYIVFTAFIFIFVIFWIVPVYFENYTIQSSLNSLQGDTALQQQIQTDGFTNAVSAALTKRFEINNIRQVTPDQAQITPDEVGGTVTINYDVKIPLVGNMFLLLHFYDSVDLSTSNV